MRSATSTSSERVPFELTCPIDPMNVAILGTGLIGGSIGLALRPLAGVAEIVAFDREPAVAAAAVERGAAHRTAGSPADACQSADVVFLATPVGSIVSTLEECLSGLGDRVVVTDVGSTKARVVAEATKLFVDSPARTFIGGHPMAGSEREGIDAARGDLFNGAWWILTPGDDVDPDPYGLLHRLLSGMGARPLALDPQRHDELMAVISHIPQLTATALMNLAAEKGKEHGALLALAAGAFRDVTRVAASNPDLWVEICLDNQDAIASGLEEFAQRLLTLHRYLRHGDADALRSELSEARDARRSLSSGKGGGDLHELAIEIPDRPGVLGHVTRLVGDLGINIEDIGISHNPEGGRGNLHLWILGRDESIKIRGVLEAEGYSPKLSQI